MQSKELLKIGIDTAIGITVPLLEDLKDAPLAFPSANGGNHAMWIAGHLAYSTGQLMWEMMLGKENPLAEWKDQFAAGTQPTDDASRYPSYEEVLRRFRGVHAEALALLDATSEAELDQPSKNVPEEFGPFFGTRRQCFLALTLHLAMHRGQAAVCRRMLGRKPILA